MTDYKRQQHQDCPPAEGSCASTESAGRHVPASADVDAADGPDAEAMSGSRSLLQVSDDAGLDPNCLEQLITTQTNDDRGGEEGRSVQGRSRRSSWRRPRPPTRSTRATSTTRW